MWTPSFKSAKRVNLFKSNPLRPWSGVFLLRNGTVLECTEALAHENPQIHRRTLFMMQCLYGMYLRISELSASKRWTPKMADFFRDGDGNWWFKTVGKGNRMRQIAVSSEMLQALKDYREYLGLTSLPSPDDTSPLIPKSRGQGPISSTPIIRRLVQGCFRPLKNLKTKINQKKRRCWDLQRCTGSAILASLMTLK